MDHADDVAVARFILVALRGRLDALADPAAADDISVRVASGDETPALPNRLMERCVVLARKTKVAALLGESAADMAPAWPEPLRDELRQQRAAVLRKNLENLSHSIKLAAVLRQDGVPFVLMKGALRSYEIFGTWDARPSNDIDVLVSHEDYGRAGSALTGAGYRRLVAADNAWWHSYLGESPYAPPDGGPIVDVHHKVQQPGAPSPKSVGQMLETRNQLEVGGEGLPVLRADYALLLAYISVSKAIRTHETWLAYALEIAVTRRGWSGEQNAAFAELARQSGVSRLVDDIDRRVRRLFQCDQAFRPDPAMTLPDRELAAAFALPMNKHRSFHRSRLLWRWTPGGPVMRALGFGALSIDRLMADFRHRSQSAQ